MNDPIEEIRKQIAERRFVLTGCQDNDVNWREAGKIMEHFMNRRYENLEWCKNHEDLKPLYEDIILGECVDGFRGSDDDK